MSKIITTLYPEPYSRCSYTGNETHTYENYTDHIRRENLKYAYTECRTYCISDYLTNECGYERDQKCYSDFISSFFQMDFFNKCADLCPLECKTEEFDYKLGFLNFPVESYFVENNFSNFINRSEDFTKLKQSVLKLTLRLDQLSYMHIVQEPKMSIQDLVAAIGGTLGKNIIPEFCCCYCC